MERLRLWRYKKLANENVREEKVTGKQSDDEDYNSCFKLKKSLKVGVSNVEFKLLNLSHNAAGWVTGFETAWCLLHNNISMWEVEFITTSLQNSE